MTPDLFIAFVAGGGVGVFLGRWWAETRRAQHDMRRAWRQRHNYRRPRR